MIEVLEFYKKCAAGTEVGAQLSLRFPGEKLVTWKAEKPLNIYDNMQSIVIRFSPEW